MKALLPVLLLAGCASGSPTEPVAPAAKSPPAAPAAATASAPAAVRGETESPAVLLAGAREDRLRAKEAADAGDGTTAQLRLLDAKAAADRLLALVPADPEALREAGRIERDSFRFAAGAARFRAALETSAARDGETVYDLAYCLAYGGDFAAALPLFEEAARLLGPQTRITVNAAICEERLGRRADGVARLARLFDAECAAGRGAGADAKLALEKTWDLTVQKRDYDGGAAALRALGEAHADRPEPFFMLGNLLAFLGRHSDAADAYEKSLAAAPTPAARARRARALASLGAGMRVKADTAVREALASAASLPETAEAAVRTIRNHIAADEPGTARDLAVAAARAIEGSLDLALAEGDAHLAEGKPDLAAAAYGRARGIDPFSTEAEARVARAALAAARANPKAETSLRDALAEPLDPAAPAETLLDFEDASLYVLPLGGVKFTDGAARFPAAPAGAGRRVYLHFFPDLSALRWTHLDVRVRAEGGPAVLKVALSDGYDQMSDAPPGYLNWPVATPVGSDWAVVSIPFRAFEPDVAARRTGTDLPRVKCAILDFAGPDGKGTPVPCIDSIALRDARTGAVRILQSFDAAPAETGILFEGTTAPFTRAIATPEAAMDLLPTGTGPISRSIVEDQNGPFEPSMAGAGEGALRVRHGETGFFPSKQGLLDKPFVSFGDGPGWVTVRFQPDRDLQRFKYLTFLARGEKGGERVRVRLLDLHSLVLEPLLPASRWPRSCFPRTVRQDGALGLGAEWRMYRVPLDAFPEVDRGTMAEIRFEVGSEVGNAPGATIYLDAIGLEF